MDQVVFTIDGGPFCNYFLLGGKVYFIAHSPWILVGRHVQDLIGAVVPVGVGEAILRDQVSSLSSGVWAQFGA